MFWDSDVAKWIEAACYFLQEEHDEEIDAAVKELADMIRKAQQPDGYLNIHYTVVEPGKRFTNLRDQHELYNCGHLIEAALAHHHHYRNDLLLNPLIKYANLLCKVFGDGVGQLRGYPGHPEIELALLRLHKVTRDPAHYALAKFFIGERGNPTGFMGKHYYEAESRRRGDLPLSWPVHFPLEDPLKYQQAHLPIVEQETIEGHSVRALYLLTAVADICLADQQESSKYLPAVKRLWDNMVAKKMYITGGVGAIPRWEGFSIDYFLPQGTDEGGCYSETCASIAVCMLAERLLQSDLNGQYADTMELALYNAVLTGMSEDGKAFTYTNQLASSPGNLSKREEWFDCACCPPNVARVMGYLGGFLSSLKQTGKNAVELNIFQYASAETTFEAGARTVKLSQTTNYPRDGKIKFQIEADSDLDVTINVRIPAWAHAWTISPPLSPLKKTKGFLTIPPSWLRENSTFELEIPMFPRLVAPHPYSNQPTVAVARGPLVYCAEDADNAWVDDHFKSVCFDASAKLEVYDRDDVLKHEKIAGIRAVNAVRFLEEEDFNPVVGFQALSVKDALVEDKVESLELIPYYARANRGGRGMMRVGFRMA